MTAQTQQTSTRHCRFARRAGIMSLFCAAAIPLMLFGRLVAAQDDGTSRQRAPQTDEQERIAASLAREAEPHETCLSPPADLVLLDSSNEAAVRAAVAGETLFRMVVRFLIVRRSDGSGGLDESLLDPYMRDLNYGFRDTPFRFVQSPEIVYIDSDIDYDDVPTFSAALSLFRAHTKDGVIDHIVTPRLCADCATGFNFAGNNGLDVRGNIVAYHRIGHPNSIVFPPHEMGHVFFLFHPFETQFGIECTSGSNCFSAGDLVCDTPASTAVFGGNTTATGIYFANQPGPCPGDPPYNPNTRLYMEAGWQAGHTLRDRFSPGEIDRMVNWLFTRHGDLIGPERPDVLVDCDGNGVDDVDEILAGDKVDLGRDLVPDVCQVLPRQGDLMVACMTGALVKGVWPANKIRFFDGETGAFRDAMWNSMSFEHQLRQGPDGYVYVTRLREVQRLDVQTGRTHDNFIDGVREGAGVLMDLLFEPSGDILVLDNFVSRGIRRYRGSDGFFLGRFVDLAATGMSSPKYMEYGPDGNIYVVGNGALGNTIQRVNAQTGGLMGSFITPGSGGLGAGQGLVFHTDGKLYVSNGTNNNILRYDAVTGAFQDVFVSRESGGLSNPHSLRFGPDGNLYVASRSTNSVKRYDGSTGAFLGDFVAPGSDGLDQPTGLLFVVPPPTGQCCFDRSGATPGCVDGVTQTECGVQPGLSLFTVGGSCSGDLAADCPCAPPSAPLAGPAGVGKNRYLSVRGNNPGINTAIQVRFASLPEPHNAVAGTQLWVQQPQELCENTGQPGPPCSGETFLAATLGCSPHFTDWSALGTVHVYHEGIIPSGIYEMQAVEEACTNSPEGFSTPALTMEASRWGDVGAAFAGGQWGPPDDLVDIVVDVVAVLDKFSNRPGALTTSRADVEPAVPDQRINITDVTRVLDAFAGTPYPFTISTTPCNP